MERLNPEAPPEAFEEALRVLRRNEAPTLIQNNQAFNDGSFPWDAYAGPLKAFADKYPCETTY